MDEKINQINSEIAEYEELITHAILIDDKTSLKLWRRALQTAKNAKRRLTNP